ncbi:MAG: Glu-tRNA(Gln) amidotransferase subunit GatE [Bacteroidales bacterium]|nr:Glu-tRNA(Gln) amidotransferase subunit GatE [Bacteroidales bacterium]
MAEKFDAKKNYELTKNEIGYVPRKKATNETYKRIGFKSGLEVHQQLKTQKKLFCNCPSGIFHNNNDYDAEIIRHMRPTLSELGEYDGTALMEFKTRKNIFYRLHNDTTCTYEIDDTPPFPINKEALGIALEISLLSKLNIVGEVHITRKQYLDGSIPTGFQRTAILGVEGEIPLKNKKVRLIQLSIEEDSCREISDIGHKRVYKTDRLGTPLIETVTYPELYTPTELAEAAQVIRFLNRSTGKVRVGAGSGREDVNVSCIGGTRVEIKGVSYIKNIHELSHNEAFRQFSLLNLRTKLLARIKNHKNWKISHVELDYRDFELNYKPIQDNKENYKLIAVNLPDFQGALSHFTQPGNSFADEIKGRLKVIACLEHPNMLHSEEFDSPYNNFYDDLKLIQQKLSANSGDAQILFWSSQEDIKTALETIEERCLMAFEGIPQETRKSFRNGTTVFERVLPGADRMYPDTDSAPIPLENSYIENLKNNLPVDISERFKQLDDWDAPKDTYFYILRNNLNDVIEKIIDLGIKPKFITSFFGHYVKNIEGKHKKHPEFDYNIIYGMFRFLVNNKIEPTIAKIMLPVVYKHPNMEFDSILTSLKFKKRSKEELFAPIEFLVEKFKEINKKDNENDMPKWVMGQMHSMAIGNVELKELCQEVKRRVL